MDVGAWLRGLGLGQYETTFRESEIDAEVLPDLTEGDLTQLGVPLGHRKRLLKAIAALDAGETGAKPPSPAPASSPATAERRPITVMFCDLVGSTSMAAKLDAEDWRTLVNTYLDEASAAVTGLGGHVLKKLGDGLMALFGYPHAQENDAERAVRAGLAIQRALVEINARNASKGAPELSARIGLDSGQVVVDATGEVFGDAPNIAARVQGAAEPGSILITATVQRQTAGLFVAEDRGQHELKGVSAPMTLYRVVRASGGGRRGGVRALTPLVGREEELDHLTRRWQRAHKGEGQLALIVGEPGLGKSRLMEEFHGHLGETPHTWVEWSSSQLLQNTPLHPIAEWGRQRFGPDLPAEQRLADLENTLGLIGLDPTEYAPLLAPLVDVLLPEDRAAKLAPEELRRRQLAAMTAWVLASARMQAVVLAFEDLHWADPTSLDLMRALAERGAHAPLLIIATARPEFRPPWSVRSHHSAISLSPLDSAQIAKMVHELSARHALPRDIVEGVSERTGGVPLFVEEVTRLLLERGEQGGAQAIPPTLQQSLAARLDRLGSARETAQIGAVLGRAFSYALLRSVAGLDEGALQSALERLAEADILFVEGDGAQATYRFKHALIQDAAYDSLLKSRRQALHAQAAEILRDSGSPEPEAVAHHFTEAGLDDLAIEWWGKAGDQALRRSAFQEAIAHLGRAIEMADKAGGAREPAPAVAQNGEVTVSERFRRQRLQVAYGNALIAARGHSTPETTEAFAKVRESEAGGADVRELAAADYGLWVASYGRGELPPMRVHSTAFLEDVAARPDSVEACVAHRVAGSTHWFAGEYREAREHLKRAVALFQPGRDDDVAFRFGQDAGVAATLYLAIVLWVLGDVARAIALAQQAHERTERIPHANTRAYGKLHMALFELIRGEVSRAVPNALELGRVARENDLPLFRALAEFLEAWAKSQTAGSADAREEMSRAADVLRERNIRCFDGPLKLAHAQEEARLGDPERAISIVDDAKADFDRRGHRAMDAELRRVRGEILLKRDPANPGPAEEALKSAIAIAQQQGARSFELRAALSLAKLYQSTGRDAEAHAVLAPALEGFAPTPEMPEIAEAQALLTALAATDEVKVEAAQRQRLTQLHAAYGNALIATRGYGAPETTEAFAKARESAYGDKDAPGRLAADFGLWAGSTFRGDLPAMRAHAAAFLSDVEARPDSPEAGVAHRAAGVNCWFAGEYREARDHLERALVLFQPGRDDDLAFRFGWDPGVGAMAYLATALWPLGEVDRAVSLIDRMQTRIADLTHVGTLANGRMHAAMFELMRGDYRRATANAFELARLTREHDLLLFRAFGVFLEGWATAATGAVGSGLEDMRRGAELLREQNVLLLDGLVKIALAEAEARAGDPDRAVATLDEALATCDRTGNRAFEAGLHRVRGETLLKQNPADSLPAEDAFLTAIAVAKQQGTRSFELRAALALAKLNQSIGRPVEARAVLAPALEGFAPTPEMPEIAEAQAMLAALAETDEVKNAAASRQRRLQLQTSYSKALMLSQGFASEEAKAAFARAQELATGVDNAAERFDAYYGQHVGSLVRGELRLARETAETLLRDAEKQERTTEAAAACRSLGLAGLFQGDLAVARAHFEQALRIFDPERDREAKFRFGVETGACATVYLALTNWLLGEAGPAGKLAEEAIARAVESGHAPTLANVYWFKASFDAFRDDAEAGRRAAESVLEVSRAHGLELYLALGALSSSWARARLGDRATGMTELRQALAAYAGQGNKLFAPFFQGRLAELEAAGEDAAGTLTRIDGALALAEQTEERWTDGLLHRIRADILLKADPANPARAEEAYLAAIAIARGQGARSFGLQAALKLAKLHQSTGRPADAYAVLAPALEGFSPTPEMPEIAEAQALLAALAATDELRAQVAQRQRLTQLHVSYGNALIAARGFGAPETAEAFARARESAFGDKDAPGRLAADYGLWVGSYVRGELPLTRAHAAAFLRDVEATPDSPEAGIAFRAAGITCWLAGDYLEARNHFERALALFQPGRDDDLAYRFGWDPGVAAMANLAAASWPLGEVDRAISLIDRMQTRMAGLTNVGTLASGKLYAAIFELMRGDYRRAAPNAFELARLAREHELPMFRAFGVFLEGSARAESGTLGSGLEDMRRGAELLREQNVLLFDGLLKIALAEAEAHAGDPGHAIAILDEALAMSDRTGLRAFEAELHRTRGEILLKRDPANPAPAEEAFGRAIAVARQQGTRSFELRAALALAKLYQSNGRPAEAHCVLAPALEGFAPTPEMPEIAEAQALLSRLPQVGFGQ